MSSIVLTATAADEVLFPSDMPWVAPQYSRYQVNLAGRTRISPTVSIEAKDAVLGVINNWRSSHSFPLNTFQMTLRDRARKVEPKALIAQRLKRLPAIEAKLRRFPEMKLSSMHLGGCRAVLRDVRRVDQLAELYQRSKSKNPIGRHEFVHDDDYIANPKVDGYRGIHLIYRYYSESKKHDAYNGLKVEIQLRSRLQHIWATAVETVDTFTGQLKADFCDARWMRFFALMGTAIALKENRPPVPATPSDAKELAEELRTLAYQLKVNKTLEAWRSAVEFLPTASTPDAHFFLLFLDADAKRLRVSEFKLGELLKAQEAYAEAERHVEMQPGAQSVLVSVEELSVLRRAYPNYFLDTRAFLREVKEATA